MDNLDNLLDPNVRRWASNGVYVIPVRGLPRFRFIVTLVDGVWTFVPVRVEGTVEGG